MEMENTTAKRWLTAKRERVVEEGPVEVDVFVRSLSPPLGVRQRQEQIFSQLQEIQETGLIDRFNVNLWGGGVCLCDVCSGTSTAESMLDSVEQFEQWADDEGDVRLPFERQQVDSAVMDRTSRELVVPSVCLSVTTGADIAGVFPCTVAGESISVTDVVDLLSEASAVETDQSANQDQVVQI
jgi:hypothetical protein